MSINIDPNAFDFNAIFKEAFQVPNYDSVKSDHNKHKVENFKKEMKAIAEDRRIHQGIVKQRERIRKEKLDEPFELGGAL